MTAINEVLRKADVALDVIIKHDEQDSNCTFKELLQEIIERWRALVN
jgi:hypothetical protein